MGPGEQKATGGPPYAGRVSDVVDLFRAARGRLAGAPRETLGVWHVPKKVLGLGGTPRIVSDGEAWHVGALLIADGFVAAVGEISRVQDPGRRGYAAESARQRAEIRAAALRGRIPEGAIVHLGWGVLDLDAVAAGGTSGPLVGGAEPMIRWSAGGGLMPLAAYLTERIDLLLTPPRGAAG